MEHSGRRERVRPRAENHVPGAGRGRARGAPSAAPRDLPGLLPGTQVLQYCGLHPVDPRFDSSRFGGFVKGRG